MELDKVFLSWVEQISYRVVRRTQSLTARKKAHEDMHDIMLVKYLRKGVKAAVHTRAREVTPNIIIIPVPCACCI